MAVWHFDANGVPSGTATAGSVNDRLQLTDPNSAAVGGATATFAIHPEPFDDVFMTAVVNPDNDININDSLFMFSRGNPATNEFYSLEVNYGDGDLIIWRSDGLAVGSNIAQDVIPGLDFDTSLYVEFETIGSNYTARAFDASGGTLLQEVTAFDDTRTGPGVTGLIASSQNGDVFLPVLGVWDDVTATSIVSTPDGDFDDNSAYDCADVDALVVEMAAGTNNAAFDLTGDGAVDGADLTAWLAEAGGVNQASGNPYLPADGNLNGAVDVSDFNVWNASKFTSDVGFCGGDYNGDGSADVSDFNIWNNNKFQTSADAAAVPEPSTAVLGMLAGLCLLAIRRRR